MKYKFYIKVEEATYGPYSAREVRDLQLMDDILVTEESISEWLPAGRFDFDDMARKELETLVNEDGTINKVPVFKDPKTDREKGGDSMKKSHKGCCRVFWKSKFDNDITYEDGLDYEESLKGNLMRVVFRNGYFVDNAEVTLKEIRNRLNFYKF
jgi:hypothetical protein